MPVRPATRADIPIMAQVIAAAFAPDRLFRVMFPHQPQHPEAFVQAFREGLWLAWYDYKKVLMVSYTVDNNQPGEEPSSPSREDARQPLLSKKGGSKEIITGFAEWERAGRGWEHVHGVWGWWDPRRVIKPLLSALFNFRRWLSPNKAAARPSPENPRPLTFWNFLPSIIPFGFEFFSAPHRQTHWSLEILAVDPAHQGHGYGTELVHAGLQKARNDPEAEDEKALPVCVIAAENKEGFYLKAGFTEIVGWASRTTLEDGTDNPLRANGCAGGAVLWTR